jgi:hypothetical protein
LLPVMVEKDFWVSWTLAVLFAHPEFGHQLVFKGGTSLSKVFGVIKRFSEDIDLSVSPAFLGISEESVEQAGSRHKRTERMKELEAACIERVRARFLPELERIAGEALGHRSGGAAWMEFQVDAMTHSPVVLSLSVHRTVRLRVSGSLREDGVWITDGPKAGGNSCGAAVGGRGVSQSVWRFPVRAGGAGTGTDFLGEGHHSARGASS